MFSPIIPTGTTALQDLERQALVEEGRFRSFVPDKLLPFSFTYATWRLYEEIAGKPITQCYLWKNRKKGVVDMTELITLLQAGLYDESTYRPLYRREQIEMMLTPGIGLLVARMVDLVVEQSSPDMTESRMKRAQKVAERKDPKYFGL